MNYTNISTVITMLVIEEHNYNIYWSDNVHYSTFTGIRPKTDKSKQHLTDYGRASTAVGWI